MHARVGGTAGAPPCVGRVRERSACRDASRHACTPTVPVVLPYRQAAPCKLVMEQGTWVGLTFRLSCP